ncbi:MAG TPA: FCD domain-containing protein [Symbiobacteriaceae bacterium]|nr:FCD domain-containing protein [Symbiobacteriaceae bacterium]
MSEGADVEYLVLSLMGQAEEPVGSGAVCDWLRRHGNTISEATVGRFLRQLDYRGLTERTGYRGRRLTEVGRARWTELQQELALSRTSREFIRALTAADLKEVIDVLIARRALEREVARLAAKLATEQDLEALSAMVSRYEAAGLARETSEADFAFHVRLAQITGNRVLLAATQLIHAQAAMALIPASIHRALKPGLSQQHREIFNAIAAHDPDRAETAMITHLDGVINAIRKHGQVLETEENA